ncbi:hypothetical protein KJ564_15410, partial [bacterium]|nr:hypothetical protein [bacterium]
MNELQKKVNEIRNRISHYLRINRLLRNDGKWARICSALDTIEDTEEAIYYYNENLSVELGDFGLLYLSVYGVLQSLFVQQDAARHLCEALSSELNEKYEFKKEQNLERIRTIRNETIGHPTKGPYFIQIDRTDLCKKSFYYTSWDPKGHRERKRVEPPNMIDSQYSTLNSIFDKMILDLDQKQKEYKDRFKDTMLAEIVKSELYPWFPQLYTAIPSAKNADADHERSQFRIVVESVLDKVKSLGVELEKREFPLDGFNEFKNRLEYAGESLLGMISDEPSSSSNELDIEI